MTEATGIIDPNRKYKLAEIYKQELIPGIDTYAKLYKYVAEIKFIEEDGKKIRKTVLRTDDKRLPILDDKNPWNMNSLLFVLGQDLIDWLEIFKTMPKRKPRATVKKHWSENPVKKARQIKKTIATQKKNKKKRDAERVERLQNKLQEMRTVTKRPQQKFTT